MLIGFLHPLYESDDNDKPQGGDGQERDKLKPSDVLAQFGQTAEGALRMAERLAHYDNDNFNLRRKNERYKQELDALRGKAAPEGGKVLTKDEAALYDAYTALGKPDAVKTALEAGKTGQERLATLERDALIRKAADAHKYNAAALAKLPSLKDKALLIEDIQGEDGKSAHRAYVQHEGGKLALPDYIAQHDPEFAPALAMEPAQAAGTPFIPQGGGSGKPAGDYATRFIERQEAQRKAQPNPLMPKGA